jgi:hypothetical protein
MRYHRPEPEVDMAAGRGRSSCRMNCLPGWEARAPPETQANVEAQGGVIVGTQCTETVSCCSLDCTCTRTPREDFPTRKRVELALPRAATAHRQSENASRSVGKDGTEVRRADTASKQ